MAIEVKIQDGVAEVIINAPPVNALNNSGWREFADKMTAVGRRDDVHCVVIRSEGRGFQVGVDVKELAEDGDLIVELNRGCYDSFAAIYDCPVPTISAVHGFCIGGGIGIAGSSDFVIAAENLFRLRLCSPFTGGVNPTGAHFRTLALTPLGVARDFRRASTPAGWQGQTPSFPQLHYEAGDPGGLHSRCAQALHAGGELLQAHQNGGG